MGDKDPARLGFCTPLRIRYLIFASRADDARSKSKMRSGVHERLSHSSRVIMKTGHPWVFVPAGRMPSLASTASESSGCIGRMINRDVLIGNRIGTRTV